MPARVLPVEWGARRSGQQVAIQIDGIDRKWLLKDITTLVAQVGVHVLSMQSEQTRNGVRVRVLYDWFGSLDVPSSFWRKLRSSGVDSTRATIWPPCIGGLE